MRARHISMRVPWHDAAWDGTVCRDPAANCHCVEYENISANRDLAVEVTMSSRPFADIADVELVPPCVKESGGFMSSTPHEVSHTHPYRGWLEETHGHLQTTRRTINPYTALAVPFRWLHRDNLEEL